MHLRFVCFIILAFYVYKKLNKYRTQLYHAEVFMGRCADVCDLLGNGPKIRWVDGGMHNEAKIVTC